MATIPPVTDRIFTANIGCLLVKKACGFVEDHQARIVEVTENRLRLKIGYSWLERLLYRVRPEPPVEVVLCFQESSLQELSEEERIRQPGIGCSQIDVTIQPRSSWGRPQDFEQSARRLLWSLREHFISPG